VEGRERRRKIEKKEAEKVGGRTHPLRNFACANVIGVVSRGGLLCNSKTLATEFECGRHGGAKVTVGPMNGGQYEFG